MSNLRRPLVLGLSTCALLLLSTRGTKRDLAIDPGEGENAEPGNEERTSRMEAENTPQKLQVESASWTD